MATVGAIALTGMIGASSAASAATDSVFPDGDAFIGRTVVDSDQFFFGDETYFGFRVSTLWPTAADGTDTSTCPTVGGETPNRDMAYVDAAGQLLAPVDTAGFGESASAVWRDVLVMAPADTEPLTGFVQFSCTYASGTTDVLASLPLRVDPNATSLYNSVHQWTMTNKDAQNNAVLRAMGFTPGESVHMSLLDDDASATVVASATGIADGAGAVTGTLTVPSDYTTDNGVTFVASGVTSRYALHTFTPQADLRAVDAVITATQVPDANAPAGQGLKVDLAGYAASASVVVALHSVSSPIVLGTVTTDATGAASATLPIPAGVSGTYQVWGGEKTVDYHLASTPVTITPPGTVGATFGDAQCTVGGATAEVTLVSGPAGRPGVIGHVSIWHDADADGTLDPGETVNEVSKPLDTVGSATVPVSIERVGITDVNVTFTDPSVSTTQRVYAGDWQYTFPAECVVQTGVVERWSGLSRFDTAVDVSKKANPGGSDVVFIANGMNFPDALAGAPAAGALGAPVLLTQTAALPDSVKAELTRLSPSKVIILGGPSVVSPAVATQLAAYGTVERWAGGDRFATAVDVSKNANPSGADVVFIANGMNFPDALAGAPAAGALDAPVLLTRADALPDAVKAELTRLAPSKVVILGGNSVVSPAVAAQLAGYGTVERWAGGSRFDTAVDVSKKSIPTRSDVVFIANGMDFPDALAGAPAAGALGAAVLLTQAGALPDAVKTELNRLTPSKVIILGGPGVVSPSVASQLQAILDAQRGSG